MANDFDVAKLQELMINLSLSESSIPTEIINLMRNLTIKDWDEDNCIAQITVYELRIILGKMGVHEQFQHQSKDELMLILLEKMIRRDVTITNLKRFLASIDIDPTGIKSKVIGRVLLYAIKLHLMQCRF